MVRAVRMDRLRKQTLRGLREDRARMEDGTPRALATDRLIRVVTARNYAALDDAIRCYEIADFRQKVADLEALREEAAVEEADNPDLPTLLKAMDDLIEAVKQDMDPERQHEAA